ncbi:hypothetical protein KAR91_88185, partial [Candidatus Pacearchaeota archaeon]|nr:hypothetical protein [Candidatus Pacearchaeota archaeon]
MQTEIGRFYPSEGITTRTEKLANERFEIAQTYAGDTFDEALVLLEDLGKTASSITPIGADIDISKETLNLGALIASGKPVMGALPGFSGLVSPDKPDVPDIIIADLNSIPSFDVTIPTLNIPNAPVYAEPTQPGDAPPIQPITVPGAPSISLPDVPTFNAISLPSEPEISIPTFDEVAPIDDLQLPDKLTTYNPEEETPYQSELLDKIQAYLIAGIE